MDITLSSKGPIGSTPSIPSLLSTPDTPLSGNASENDVERFQNPVDDHDNTPPNNSYTISADFADEGSMLNMMPDFEKWDVINDSGEAVDYYFFGDGDSIELSDDVKQKIMNHPSVLEQTEKNMNGTGKKPYSIHIDFEGEGWDVFHVGDTNVSYTEDCIDGMCTTTYTAPIFNPEGALDRFENPLELGFDLPGCKPYYYKPFSWSVTYPDPLNPGSFPTEVVLGHDINGGSNDPSSPSILSRAETEAVLGHSYSGSSNDSSSSSSPSRAETEATLGHSLD